VNPRHYFAHVLLAHHPAPTPKIDVSAAVREHFEKALSVEAVTKTVRERLARRREKDALREQLSSFSRELRAIGRARDARVIALEKKIEEMKKKIGPTGPLP
jgi:hypothetical protein